MKINDKPLTAWPKHVNGPDASLDTPPDFPFFNGRKSKGKSTEITSSPVSRQPTPQASPGRKVHMRTECIEQLKKVGELLENGLISVEQHKQLQEAIMKDIT